MKKSLPGFRPGCMRIFSLALLMMVTVFMFGTIPAMAAEDSADEAKGYTYTVTFSAGDKGKFNSKSVPKGGELSKDGKTITFKDLAYDADDPLARPSFTNDIVKLTDERYYVQGIRESGKDNVTVGQSAPAVTEDADYVVAYGIKGEQVKYTVNYRTAAGKRLHKSQTYYGNVGDKPVVAFLYVEGYYPQAYNLTKTLTANAADNEFTFIYKKVVKPKAQTTTTTTTTNRNTNTGTTTYNRYSNTTTNRPTYSNNTTTTTNDDDDDTDNVTGADDTDADNTDAADTDTDADDTDAGTDTDTAANPDDTDVDPQTGNPLPEDQTQVPQEEDLDENQTALAPGSGQNQQDQQNQQNQQTDENTGLSSNQKIGIIIGIIAVIVVILLILYLLWKKGLLFAGKNHKNGRNGTNGKNGTNGTNGPNGSNGFNNRR